MTAPHDTIRRIEELESQVAFQENLYEQLNEVVARQDRDIRELQEQLKDLSRRLKEVGDSVGAAGTGEEVPPHY